MEYLVQMLQYRIVNHLIMTFTHFFCIVLFKIHFFLNQNCLLTKFVNFSLKFLKDWKKFIYKVVKSRKIYNFLRMKLYHKNIQYNLKKIVS